MKKLILIVVIQVLGCSLFARVRDQVLCVNSETKESIKISTLNMPGKQRLILTSNKKKNVLDFNVVDEESYFSGQSTENVAITINKISASGSQLDVFQAALNGDPEQLAHMGYMIGQDRTLLLFGDKLLQALGVEAEEYDCKQLN